MCNKRAPITFVPTDLPVMLDVKTAAEIWDGSQKFIRDQLRKGVIRGTKLGGSWRINRDEFLEQCGLL